jgi:hypothetical protein
MAPRHRESVDPFRPLIAGRRGADERVDVLDRIRDERGLVGVRRGQGAGQHHAEHPRRDEREAAPAGLHGLFLSCRAVARSGRVEKGRGPEITTVPRCGPSSLGGGDAASLSKFEAVCRWRAG